MLIPIKFYALELDSKSAFFNSLSALCGETFEGEMTFPTQGQDSFAGKVLVAKIDACSETEIRVPFHVGLDKSRTWIISKTEQGLQLKHDHRYENNTPHKINMYGGVSDSGGSALSQSFYADDHTKSIIPAASTNVWSITLNQQGTTLIYYLERHNAPRFKAVLKRRK